MAVSQFRARGRSRTEHRSEGPAFLDDLLAMAGSLANSRKEYASTQLENFADAMRQFSETMPSMPTVKTYAETAADGLEDLASYVLESDLSEMISDAREMARRHPIATFGGSVLAGVVLTQIVQARAEAMRDAVHSRRQRQSSRRKRSDERSDGEGGEEAA